MSSTEKDCKPRPVGRKRDSTEMSSSSSFDFAVNDVGYLDEDARSLQLNMHTLDKRCCASYSGISTYSQTCPEVPSRKNSKSKCCDDEFSKKEDICYRLSFKAESGETRYIFANVNAKQCINTCDSYKYGELQIAQDVTESVQRDKEAASISRELRQLLDAANVSIFGIGIDGIIHEWNKKTTVITGYSRQEAVGKAFVSTFIVPALQDSIQDMLNQALKGDEISNYELEFRTKSNEIRYMLVNVTTRRDDANNIVGVVAVGQDVTMHDKSVNVNAPLFGIDVVGRVKEWNEKTAEITGFSKEESLHKPLVSTFIVQNQRPSVQRVLDRALKGGETSSYNLEFRTKSNTTRRDAENNIVGVVGVAQDVSGATKHELAANSVPDELRQLVETANAPIFGIDIHGNVNEWNDKTAEITGFSKDEALDKPLVSTFIVPQLRQSVESVLGRALEGDETSNYELEFRTKTNETRFLLVNATTRRDAERNIVGVVGVAQDVTENTKHDRAIKSIAEELRQLVDTANAPIFGIDIHGNVNEWNDKTAEITGYKKEEALDKPLVSTFIVPKLRDSVQDVLDRALKGDETSNYDLEFRTKSNQIRHLLINATTRRDPENYITGVVGVAQDVTEAVERDNAICSMARELRQLVDSANAPIFGIDVNGNVNEWNDKTAEVTGFSSEEAFTKPLVSTFIVPELRPSVQDVLDRALKGEETSNYELEFRTKSNEIRYLLVNATTRRDPDNNIVGVVGVAQDVTEATNQDRAVKSMATELRQLINTANAPIFGIDIDGNVNEWNDKTAEITGFKKEEALNKPLVSTFIVPQLHSSVQSVLDRALKGDETSNYELEFRTKTDETRYLLVNATTRRDAESHVVGVVGVAQDVTETTKHDRAVKSMAEELRQLVDTANAPIFGIDIHGNVNEWNDKTAEITGFRKEEALNKPLVSTFIVPQLRQSVQSVLEKALKGDETSNYELEFRTATDETRYLLVNATTRRDAESHVVGVVGVAQDVTETAKRDRAVKAMAEELRQLVDTANAPIFGIDISGNVNEWNDKTAEITGYSKEEALSKPLVSTFIVPKLRESVQGVLDRALQGFETSNYDLEFRTKSNEIRHLLVNATTRRDPESNVIGVVGVAQDVTEAVERDNAVRSMARELRQLVDTANAPIFGIDVDGNVNEWNDKTAEITGFSKEEALSKPLVYTFIVQNLRQSVQTVLDRALTGDETSNYELKFRTKSNETRYLLVNATTRRDANNRIVGVVGVAQDVTKTTVHDRAVASIARELRQLVDTANAPIFGIDIDGNVNEWNDKTAEITGFRKEEAMNKPLVSTFIVPQLRQSVQDIMDKALKGDETSNYELEFRTKENEIRYLLVNATTRRDSDSHVVGVVGVAQDVTDDRKHSEELRRMQFIRTSQEAKLEVERSMTAYFAHELRNPLHAIDSALGLMPSNLSEDSKLLVDGMAECIAFMSSIMNNLLDVRKMEEGEMELYKIPMSLKVLLEKIHSMLLPSVRPGVKMMPVCEIAECEWVLGDSHRIQQVLTNVISNAIKYTTDGSIILSMKLVDGVMRFECTDTGPGIPKKDRTNLFRRFVQRGGAPGTGLGLAISKQLVDLMGGRIFFESDPTIKVGACCIVELPLELCNKPDPVKKEQETSMIEDPIKMLLVDDAKMIRTMFKRRIIKFVAPNAQISEACNGEEALEICSSKTSKFDIIVVDQYMEEAGGVLLGTETIRAMRRMKLDSIIIGCSGNEIENEFRKAGSDWVMKKPTPPNSTILKSLRNLLAKKKLARS